RRFGKIASDQTGENLSPSRGVATSVRWFAVERVAPNALFRGWSGLTSSRWIERQSGQAAWGQAAPPHATFPRRSALGATRSTYNPRIAAVMTSPAFAITELSCAVLRNAASYALGARYTPRSRQAWKKRPKIFGSAASAVSRSRTGSAVKK